MNRTASWRSRIHEVIFGTETPAGKTFDVLLIVSIFLSIIVVMLDSVTAINAAYGRQLFLLEWFFTLLFTIEYLLRLSCSARPWRYVVSFFGIIDLLAILPNYLSLLVPGAEIFLVIRSLRVLRIFRIFLVIIFGSLIYVIEGEANGFTSIPKSIYWAIVTMTTVGYGDISPKTAFGQTLAALIMIIGYSIIAVPTGIVTADITQRLKKKSSDRPCPECGAGSHDGDAEYCKFCGASL